MIELNASEFANVLPLLNGIQQQVLPWAICQGINPGRVFVDLRENPQNALIWSPVGYYFLAGHAEQTANLDDMGRTLRDVFMPATMESGENSFILITSGETWKAHLPILLPEREVVEIYRRPFLLDRDAFAALGSWRERIPAGFTMRAVDAALAEEAGVLASWASVEDFQAWGLGFALLDGEKPVSMCTTVFASREKVEMDVHTDEAYRRRGFAQLTSAALIEACLQGGRQPNWECFWENEASTALALQLGFAQLPDYPVYYWEA